MARVFVYGTLTDREQVEALLDRFTLGSNATLRGLQRIEGRYPTLAPGGEYRGQLVALGKFNVFECAARVGIST